MKSNFRFPVFHIPHTGYRFPPELLSSVCVPEEVFRHYHDLMSDTDVWQFIPKACLGGDMMIRFDISRLLCDPERFVGPEEEMEQYGMGFCYEKAFDGTVIKNVTEELKQQTRKYYDLHHARMDLLCDRHPRILLFDMHSFSEEALPEFIRRRTVQLPDVCIGTDPMYTPRELIRRIENRLDKYSLTHRINTPYSGTFIPNAVLSKRVSCDLISVMFEFNKRIYLDENGKTDGAKAIRIRNLMNHILADCVDLS